MAPLISRRIVPSTAFTRLFVLVASVALLTSRVMLLLHEFCGHGATAMVFGGRITGWNLFLFAGGRVSYELAELGVGRRLLISLGGVALEVLLGTIAIVVARRMRERHVAAFCSLCVGTVLVGHGAVYLARGVHYGFGDGALLARLLDDKRWAAVFAASALAVATAVYCGRRLAALPAALFTGPPWRVAGATLLAFLCAGILHGALAWVEVTWFPDPQWVAIMEDASRTAARAELRRRIAEARRRGEPLPSTEDQQRIVDTAERARRPWPLDPVLAGAVLTALVVGVTRGAREAHAVAPASRLPSWRAIGTILGALAVMLAIIVALRHLGAHR